MAQGEYSSPNRAQQVWSRFAGLFGADALKRKFGMTPPPEWESGLSELSDAQLVNGMARVKNSGSDHIPTLPAFLQLCRTSNEWHGPYVPKDPPITMDKWAIAANYHLMAHIRRHPKKYAPDSRYDGAVQAGPLTKTYTGIVVQFKNAWAEDMRADDKGEGVTIAHQKAAWDDCMARADEQIRLMQVKAA